jgi:hypothetical protein
VPSLWQLLVAAVKEASDPVHSVEPLATERCQEALNSLSEHFLHLVRTADQQGGESAAADFLQADGLGVVCAAMESYPAQIGLQVRRGWILPS